MSREILISTPENIAIEYELAGIGSRFVANFIDTMIQLMIFVGVAFATTILDIALMALAAFEGWKLVQRLLAQAAEFVSALAIILCFLVFWGYYIYFEKKWNGQTPGKRSLGIRVIREGGYPVDTFSVIVRAILRILDFLPLFYFVGLVSIICTANYQRIGDLLAGTIVVKQRAPRNLINLLQSTRLKPEHLDRDALAMMQREADRLTPEQYQAVRHFTERRRDLTNWDAQQSAAGVLAIPLMEKLHIVPPPGAVSVNYADVLEYLAVAYEEARRPKDSRPVEPPPQPPEPTDFPAGFMGGMAPMQGVSKHR